MKTATVNIIGLKGILQRIVYNSMRFYKKMLGKAISPNTSHPSFTKNFPPDTMEKIESIVGKSRRKNTTMQQGLTIDARIIKTTETIVTHL
jgi:hypothetical protein